VLCLGCCEPVYKHCLVQLPRRGRDWTTRMTELARELSQACVSCGFGELSLGPRGQVGLPSCLTSGSHSVRLYPTDRKLQRKQQIHRFTSYSRDK
jgi:hypothetical protein